MDAPLSQVIADLRARINKVERDIITSKNKEGKNYSIQEKKNLNCAMRLLMNYDRHMKKNGKGAFHECY